MKIKAPDALLAAEVSRRGLMKTTAIGGLAMASSAFTLPFTRIAHAANALAPVNETVTWSASVNVVKVNSSALAGKKPSIRLPAICSA